MFLWPSGSGLTISRSTMLFFSEGSDYHAFYWQKTVTENGDMPKSIKAEDRLPSDSLTMTPGRELSFLANIIKSRLAESTKFQLVPVEQSHSKSCKHFRLVIHHTTTLEIF